MCKKLLFTDAELQKFYEEMCQLSLETGLDPYNTYIQILQNSNFNGLKLEQHHTIPRFDNGTNNNQNLIYLPIREHVKAHWLRWKIFQKKGDLIAFNFRVSDIDEIVALRAKLILDARLKDQEEKKGFFNSSFQSEMGKRGGAKNGRQNTKAQFLARQQVGLNHGKTTGILNQSPKLKEFLSSYVIWGYDLNYEKPHRYNAKAKFHYYILQPKESFIDIVRTLNKFIPGKIPETKNISSMYKIVKGERPQMYGWRILEKFTRSEYKTKLEAFYKANPFCNVLLE